MPSVIHEYAGSFSGAEGEVEYRIHFEVTSAGRPAYISGPPENCYPAEGPEWHITKIEQAVYLPDQREPTWIDIRKALSPEAQAHIESWAEDLDLSDEVVEEYQADDDSDYKYEQYMDRMSGYDD